MPQIDFFILEEADEQRALRFCCELIEKMYMNNESIYVHAAQQKQAERLHTLLWTFKDISFVPHTMDKQEKTIPIKLGFDVQESHPVTRHILNLHPEVPPFARNCERIFEVVFADPNVQQWGRERYRCYREQNHAIKIHKIKSHEYERVLNEFN